MALVAMPVSSVQREHIAELYYRLRDRRGTASNVLWVLSKLLNFPEPNSESIY